MKEYLSFGTMGHNHLLAGAQKALRKAGQYGGGNGFLALGARLLCMAWSEFPLNTPLAAELGRLAGTVPAIGRVLSPAGVRLATRLGASAQEPIPADPQQLFDAGDYPGMRRFFETRTSRKSPLPTVRQALLLNGLLSEWEWLEGYLEQVVAPTDPELAELLLADVYLCGGKSDRAVSSLEQAVERYGLSCWGMKLAAAHAGAGNADRAVEALARILADFPDHTTALLLMDSLAFPASRDHRLDGGCAVSIYSYDKADELGRTLDSLLASDLGPEVGDVTVRVLINGSRDDSLAVAERAKSDFPGGMEVVSLPVNVGAPAARNWLLQAAREDGAEFIAYLDDDVLLPRDWLAGFAAGVHDFPEAGVWGCRVNDVVSPSLTQHGDGFLLSAEDAALQQHRVVLQEPCVECLAPSQLGYRRYAASVTGCCHLFRTDALAAMDGFDLHFSPSQFDDLDLDLRQLGQGRCAAYLGDIQVTHLRPSNHFLTLSEGARQRSENHRALLEERHGGQLDRLFEVQAESMRADLSARRERLAEAGLIGPVRSA